MGHSDPFVVTLRQAQGERLIELRMSFDKALLSLSKGSGRMVKVQGERLIDTE